MLVLFNGTDFMYIPLEHIQNLEMNQENEENIQGPTEDPSIQALENQQDLTFKETLEIAIGGSVEIYVTDNQPLHGQITSVKDDYFVFYSPIYKTMYIPNDYLKWLIPYTLNGKSLWLAGNEKKLTHHSRIMKCLRLHLKQIEKVYK